MQILQVSIYSDLKFGGPAHKIHALSTGLATRGYKVQVLTFRPQQAGVNPYEQDGNQQIKVRYLPWIGRGLWQLPTAPSAIRRMIQQADVVHCYGLYDLLCPAAAFYAHLLQRPYILEPLGMYVPRAGNTRAKLLYHQIFTTPMARRAARVIATSPAEMAELAPLVEPVRLVLRRNGIDLAQFQHLPDKSVFYQEHNIQAHNIAPDERILLYIGRISPIKNLEMLVAAFKTANLARVRLLLVGPMLEADYAERLKSLISELKLNQQVLLTGPLYDEDKRAALAAAHLLILPSQYESFGNAAAEAVAAGVPVLLTETCGIAPLINKRAGLAVPLNVNALADGLHTLVDDKVQREILIQQRQDVLQELSWEEPLKATEELYETIVRESKGQRIS